MPDRIQLQRQKGWRKPATAMVVARPTRWGNPFVVGVGGDRAACVESYRQALLDDRLSYSADDVRRELHGHDLACWCPPGEPCHADVLLEVSRTPVRVAPLDEG